MNMSDLLPGRAKLKGIRRLLLSGTAQKVLAVQLRAILPPGAAVGPFHLAEVHFKPGRKITAYYDPFANAKSPKGHYVRPIAVTWGQNAHADRQENTTVLATIHAEAVRRGVTVPFQQLWADFREWNMHVSVSPPDARFTQLVRMSDRQYVRAVLAGMGVGASHLAGSGEYTVTSLKHRPKERSMRARLYEAIGLIKCAVRRVQLFEHDWAYRTAALVEHAQTVLNDLQFSARYTCKPTVPEGSTRP